MTALNWKEKLKSPTRQKTFKAELLKLPGFDWQESGEQYCQYRLDAKGANGGWLRVKQFNNGTLYVESSSQSYIQQVQALLGKTPQTTTKPQSSAPSEVSELDLPSVYFGSDESGKGDYFGPLVTAGVVVDTEKALALKQVGVMDSKALKDTVIQNKADEILRILGAENIAVVVLFPEQYNQVYEDYKRQKRNLNHMLGRSHARVIQSLAQSSPLLRTQERYTGLTDRFGKEHYVLDEVPPEIRQRLTLYQLPRAEADVAVATASMVARLRFLQGRQQLIDKFGEELPLGAGPPVLKAGRFLVKSYGHSILKQVAKLHFKTTQQL